MKVITKHADKRMRERIGIPRKALKKKAEIALERGVAHKECTGRLKKYVDWVFLSHVKGSDIRLFGEHVYIFTNSRLVTVLPLPNIYKDAVRKLIKRKEEKTLPILPKD